MSLDKADSISQVNNLFPDNVTGEITPADQRVVSTNIITSNLNLVDAGPQTATGSASLSAKQITINDLSHLPLPSGGVITLEADTLYFLGNDIDFGTTRITLSDGTVFKGLDERVVTVTYSGTSTMFTAVNVGFRIEKLKISCPSGAFFNGSDAGSKVFCFNNLDVIDSDTLGLIDGCEFFDIHHCDFKSTTDGFMFSGSIDEFHIHNSVIDLTAGVGLDFATAVFDTIDVDDSSFILAAGSIGASGLVFSGNINAGGLGKFRFTSFSGSGTKLVGISSDDALWNFVGNDDIADSRPDGLLSFIDNITETIITVSGVEVLVAGTWNIIRSSQFTGSAAGRLTYNGGRPVVVPVTASTAVTVSSGVNQELHLHLFLNGSIIEESKVQVNVDSTDTKNQTNVWQLVMNPGDFIELFVSNESTTNNVTVSDAKLRVN